jgi:hypothetical protein
MGQIQLKLRDETGQRRATMQVEESLYWSEVTPVASDTLALPPTISGEPIIYHLFDDRSGESLQGTVAETLSNAEAYELEILIAPDMSPAKRVS